MKYHVEFDIDFKRNLYKGKFIAIEGIDGSGKTTQAQRIVKELKKRGRKAVYTKEPTDGEIGQLIRKVLAQEVKVPPEAIQYLIASDRVVHHEEIIEHLEKGQIVVSDRYFWSSVAYGLADKEIRSGDRSYLLSALSVLSFYNQFILPDVTFYLEISVDEATRRLSQMDKTKELYERREKLEKIADGYSWLVKKFGEEFTVVNGEKPAQEITEEILKKLI